MLWTCEYGNVPCSRWTVNLDRNSKTNSNLPNDRGRGNPCCMRASSRTARPLEENGFHAGKLEGGGSDRYRLGGHSEGSTAINSDLRMFICTSVRPQAARIRSRPRKTEPRAVEGVWGRLSPVCLDACAVRTAEGTAVGDRLRAAEHECNATISSLNSQLSPPEGDIATVQVSCSVSCHYLAE